jgi:hypothetical protein
MFSPYFSPAFCCGRRCAAPSSAFSPRGAPAHAGPFGASCLRQDRPAGRCVMSLRTVKHASAPWRSGRSPQYRPPMGLVSRGQGARRKSMPEHLRRRATTRSATTPIGPKGCGGMGPASSLLLLGDGGTSLSSRRLESGPMARATDRCWRALTGPLRSKTRLGTAPRRPRDETR